MPDLATKGPFVTGLPDYPGLDQPTVDSMTYVLYDDDAQVCRTIDQAELDASSVDRNIDTYQLQDVNWLTLDVDNQTVVLTYTSGAQASLTLGTISLDLGEATREFRKANGIIWPLADLSTLALNRANTPNLVAIRNWYLAEAKRVNDERIEIAEVVHSFAEIIAANSGLDGIKTGDPAN